MATKKSAKKGAAGKKSAAKRSSSETAGQPDLDMKIDLMEMPTAPGQTVDQHPRPIIPPLIFPPMVIPPIPSDE